MQYLFSLFCLILARLKVGRIQAIEKFSSLEKQELYVQLHY